MRGRIPKITICIINEKGCWEWQGNKNHDGYGRVTIRGKKYTVSRLILKAKLNRKLLKDEMALHICDNPPCCNPEHIFLGDHTDNVRDMYRKNRAVDNRGEKQGSSKLTTENVIEIRKLYASGKFTQKDIGKIFDINPDYVSQIYHKQRWKQT